MAGNELTPKQVKLIAALLDPRNRTIDAACAAAGVPLRTYYNWREEGIFQRALDAHEDAVVGDVARRLSGTLPTVEKVYLSIMADTAQPANARLRAARNLADLWIELVSVRTLARRIAALEESNHAST